MRGSDRTDQARLGRLDLSGLNVRFYRGLEDQAADPLIVAKEGTGNAPAHRGLAYAVFERLPLEPFSNRIPQLSFEVVRPVGALERMVRAVTLIPGTTEFGYEPATVAQTLGPGQSASENRHVTIALSDVEAALDDLQAMCPSLERVAIVVAWFGSDLRAGQCRVEPGVDSNIKLCLSGYYPHPQHVGCCPATGQVVAEAARPTCRVFGWTPDRQTKTIRSAACASAP